MRILVIGGSGLVGSNVVEIAFNSGIDVHSTYNSRETEHTDIRLDKTDEERTAEVVERVDPDLIVDTAAFHAVDDCETERDFAWGVNAAGTRNVAIASNDVNAHLIYLSTDYVFSGNREETPYVESDSVAPLNYYAETKYAGEQAAKIANEVTVLRPSVIYGLSSENFVTWALGELEEGNELTIVDDQTSAPTYAPDLARACIEIAKRNLTGLYHATGPSSMNRYEFTITLARECNFSPDLVKPTSTEKLGQKAPRPEDSTLDSSRLYEDIEFRFNPPEEAFAKMRTEL